MSIKAPKITMDIDPRAMPAPEEQEIPEPTAEDKTSKNDTPAENNFEAELELLKTKNLELQKQKEHWREKYERDINSPKPSENEPDYLIPDEDQTHKEILELRKELNSFKENNILEKLSSQYPAIKDKSDEFNEFRAEYPGVALDKVAKIFLSEKGYVEQLAPRKGLEKPTGGQKSQQKSGVSQDEVKRLRETQPRRYQQMLRDGKLNPDEIN